MRIALIAQRRLGQHTLSAIILHRRCYTKMRNRMNRTAQCCCGDLKLEISGEPELHSMCHCNNCKKRTGSAFGLSAYFKSKSVKCVSGVTSCYELHNTNDGFDQKRYFCVKCGTTLYWFVSSLPDLTGVASGCIVENPLNTPRYSVSHSEKYTWVMVPPDIEKNG